MKIMSLVSGFLVGGLLITTLGYSAAGKPAEPPTETPEEGPAISAVDIPAEPQWENEMKQGYLDIYDKDRFEATDLNNDGVLDKEELRDAQMDFEYYMDNERFQHADTNDDGVLSMQEIIAERRWEIENREKLERMAFQDLKMKNPDGDFSDDKWLADNPDVAKVLAQNGLWLKSHPKVTERLFLNHEWLMNHPGVAEEIFANRRYLYSHHEFTEKLYQNRKWLAEHPEIAREMYANRYWLNRHPEIAKELYQDRKWLIEHPNVARVVYQNKEFSKNDPWLDKQSKDHQQKMMIKYKIKKKGG